MNPTPFTPLSKEQQITLEVKHIIDLVMETKEPERSMTELYSIVEAAYDYRSSSVFWQELYGRCQDKDCPTIKSPSIRDAIRQAYEKAQQIRFSVAADDIQKLLLPLLS